MKARIDSNGEILDVAYVPTGKRTGYYKDMYTDDFYSPDAVTIIGDSEPHHPDWQAYRMDVAKECMAVMMNKKTSFGYSCEAVAKQAVNAADMLIACLKEQKDN